MDRSTPGQVADLPAAAHSRRDHHSIRYGAYGWDERPLGHGAAERIVLGLIPK